MQNDTDGALFDRAPVGYFILDRNGRIERANAKAASLVGVHQERLVGRPFVVFLVPESHAPFVTYLSDVFSAAGKQRQRRFRLVTRDRAEKWLTLASRAEEEPVDKPVCYVAAFDATDEVQTRRKLETSEHRYRLIVESMNDAVYLASIDPAGRPGRFVAVNRRAMESLGYSEEELLALGASDINAPASRKLIPEFAQQLRRDGRAVHEFTHRRNSEPSLRRWKSARASS